MEASRQRFVPAPPGEGSPDLYRKLLLLTGIRLLVGTALLVATAFLTLNPEAEGFPRRVEAFLYAIIGIIYLGSLVAGWFLRSGRYLSAVAHVQIVGDVVVATGLVYLTGGAESFFTILYPLAIVSAALGLSRRGAMLGAALSAVAFCALAIGVERGLLPPPLAYLDRPPLATPKLALTIGANLCAFLLTAMLAAHLAEALRGARKELAGLEALHRNIVESVASGIVTTDADGRITYLNPAFADLTGLTFDNVRGKLLIERFPEFDRVGNGEARIAGRVVSFAVSPFEAEGGGNVVVVQDLTELRRMEEEVRRADRLAALGKMSAGLAHEIRNPLASMCGSIALLGKQPGLGAKERKLLTIVSREGERLEALVRDFLAFARPSQPQIQQVEATQLVEETLDVFRQDAAARELRVSVEIEPGVRVLADPGQLRQVLWNLLSNAADAAGRGGSVRTRVRRIEGMAVLEVEDSGPGIAGEDLQRIFDPFFTTKESGTGLGLAIVHRIVEAHGGQLAVQSVPGRTLFSVAMPLAAPAVAGQPLQPRAGVDAATRS